MLLESSDARILPSLRAGQMDRDAFVGLLKDGYVRGCLNERELGARIEAAMAAVTLEELAQLTSDLPKLPPVARPVPRQPSGGGRSPVPVLLFVLSVALGVLPMAFLANSHVPAPITAPVSVVTILLGALGVCLTLCINEP